MVRVLFVCMGNICRSPTAHGFFEDLVKEKGLSGEIKVDSAGTIAHHIGESPDPRSQQTARNHGVEISHQRARQVITSDFSNFDYILAMDTDNFENLIEVCPSGYEDRIHMFLSFAPELDHKDVPDPYYSGDDGFELVFSLIKAASIGLLNHISENKLGQKLGT